MLYSVFIYESSTGILMWEKNFDASNTQQLEMFSSFFAAIKSFVQEMVVRGSKNNTLKNIEMGTHIINIVSIKDLSVDLVFIADAGDEGKLKKVAPKIIEVLQNYKSILVGWQGGNMHVFEPLSAPIQDILTKQKGLIDQKKSLTDDHEIIIKEIFNKRGKLGPAETAALQQERERLTEQLASTTNLLTKHRLLDQICQIDQRCADDENFLTTSKQQGLLTQELSDLHYKLNYWLQETKANLTQAVDKISHTQKAIKDGDYKDAYRTFADFAANLKKIADKETVIKFQGMSRQLIDKTNTPPELLSQTIQEIMKLNDDAFEVIKEVSAAEEELIPP
ncbi:MAG TPA: hypothetical protein VKK79_12590 [Candidatus Lokiarchaeia archaeon]|nr:hypothetical protein [Candidatus Lokiarchaeia archaeon]